jgi:signal transduction histidine kinase
MKILTFLGLFVPRRTVSQIVALVAVCVVLHQIMLVIVAYLLVPSLIDPTLKFEPFVIRSVAVAQMLNGETNSEARLKIFEAALRASPTIRIENPTTSYKALDKDSYGSILVDAVGESLRQSVSVSGIVDDKSQTRILVKLPDGFSWSSVIPNEPEGGYPAAIMLAGLYGSFALVLLASSLWAARLLALPLRRLAAAAEKFDADQPYTVVAERGPSEVVKVARAFNEMGRRTSQLVEDRMHLIAAVSHDLRTPITRLRLRLEGVESAELKKQMISDLTVMDRMVHSSLNFVRGMGREQDHQTVDVTSLLQTICDDYANAEHLVTFTHHARFLVMCDQDQITRAISNLIENSLKFETPVNLSLSENEPGMVDIVVADLGPGIPNNQKLSVLKPFKRGEDSRNLDSNAGFGMGLSICSAIAASHGGKILLEDSKPHGLTVRLRLPVAD